MTFGPTNALHSGQGISDQIIGGHRLYLSKLTPRMALIPAKMLSSAVVLINFDGHSAFFDQIDLQLIPTHPLCDL